MSKNKKVKNIVKSSSTDVEDDYNYLTTDKVFISRGMEKVLSSKGNNISEAKKEGTKLATVLPGFLLVGGLLYVIMSKELLAVKLVYFSFIIIGIIVAFMIYMAKGNKVHKYEVNMSRYFKTDISILSTLTSCINGLLKDEKGSLITYSTGNCLSVLRLETDRSVGTKEGSIDHLTRVMNILSNRGVSFKLYTMGDDKKLNPDNKTTHEYLDIATELVKGNRDLTNASKISATSVTYLIVYNLSMTLVAEAVDSVLALSNGLSNISNIRTLGDEELETFMSHYYGLDNFSILDVMKNSVNDNTAKLTRIVYHNGKKDLILSSLNNNKSYLREA